MFKEPSAMLNSFLENYPGKIKERFIDLVKTGKNKFIFDGPSGSGKSFFASAFANTYGMRLEVINLYLLDNIDEQDQADLFLSMISKTATSTSLFGPAKKVLFIEDIDKLILVSPTVLNKLVDINNTIIIFESREGSVFRAKIKPFVRDYEIIRFYRLNDRVVRAFLYRILSSNKLTLSEEMINKIITNAHGNLSSALTDLNLAIIAGKNMDLPSRIYEDSIFEQLDHVFFVKDGAVNTKFYSDTEAKNFEIWEADKAPLVFNARDNYRAFDLLSFADILLMKIKKQNWGLLKYIQAILFNGIGALAVKKSTSITYYAPDWNLYYRTD
jgi:DNA polymerase III delta prime subunit